MEAWYEIVFWYMLEIFNKKKLGFFKVWGLDHSIRNHILAINLVSDPGLLIEFVKINIMCSSLHLENRIISNNC
jgi:hypothetical protein